MSDYFYQIVMRTPIGAKHGKMTARVEASGTLYRYDQRWGRLRHYRAARYSDENITVQRSRPYQCRFCFPFHRGRKGKVRN